MTKKFKCLKKEPKLDKVYFQLTPNTPHRPPDTGHNSLFCKKLWSNSEIENISLSSRRVYAKRKYARRAAKFFKAFLESHKEQLNCLTTAPNKGETVWSGWDMDDNQFCPKAVMFDSDNIYHQRLLNLSLLYKNREDVVKASNLITQALEEEEKRRASKSLIKPPEQGTPVYYPDFDNYNPSKFGVACIHYDSNKLWHVLLFKRGLLFLKEKHAIQASKKMLQRINPSVCELTLKPTI